MGIVEPDGAEEPRDDAPWRPQEREERRQIDRVESIDTTPVEMNEKPRRTPSATG